MEASTAKAEGKEVRPKIYPIRVELKRTRMAVIVVKQAQIITRVVVVKKTNGKANLVIPSQRRRAMTLGEMK